MTSAGLPLTVPRIFNSTTQIPGTCDSARAFQKRFESMLPRFGLISLLAVLFLLNSARLASGCEGAATKPVTLRGDQLGSLVGEFGARLKVFAYRSSNFVLVPFQVDQKLPNGDYALTGGPDATAANDRAVLGPDDEIVVMRDDFGDRVADRRALPINSVEIAAPGVNGSICYAYVAAVNWRGRTLKRYVNYDANHEEVTTSSYSLQLRNELPAEFSFLGTKSGGTEQTVTKFEADADASLFNHFSIHFGDSNIQSELLAYRIGPIRIIRKVRLRVSLGFGIHSPAIIREDFFYGNSINELIMLEFPRIPGFLFPNIKLRASMLFPTTSGLSLSWSSAQGESYKLTDPSLDFAIRVHPEASWLMLSSANGSYCAGFLPTPSAKALSIVLFSSGSHSSPSGNSGMRIGYLVTGWRNLSKGPAHFEFIVHRIDDSYPRCVPQK
jgi:hypothetical protein